MEFLLATFVSPRTGALPDPYLPVRPTPVRTQSGMTIHPTAELTRCLRRHPAGDVLAWRVCWLLESGFDPELARSVAATDVDLHALLELVDRGCPPELAARILSPLPTRDAG
jgi:hypothetical protein